MTLSDMREKDVVNVPDGRVLGKVIDLEFCARDGNVEAIIVPGPFSVAQLIKGERNGLVIPWALIQKIGDDVILVCLEEPTA